MKGQDWLRGPVLCPAPPVPLPCIAGTVSLLNRFTLLPWIASRPATEEMTV